MKKIMKTSGGITLIALVITIVVLLILSGVAITLTLGNNGILSKTQVAKDEHIKQEATETMNLKVTEIQLKSYGENKRLATLQYLADKLCEDEDMEYVIKKQKEQASLKKIDVSDVKSIFTKIKKYPYEFEIDSSLKLASIDGVQIADIQNPSNEAERIEELSQKILQMQDKVEELNNTITDLQEKNESLQTSINNIKNEISSQYIYTELASTAFESKDQTKEITLNDSLENYKYIMIVNISGLGNYITSGMLPVSVFKNINGIGAATSFNTITASYVNNTKCTIKSGASETSAIVYGIN